MVAILCFDWSVSMGIPSIYRFMNAVCTSVHGIARAAHVLKGTREVESEGAQEHNMNAALVLVVVCVPQERNFTVQRY